MEDDELKKELEACLNSKHIIDLYNSIEKLKRQVDDLSEMFKNHKTYNKNLHRRIVKMKRNRTTER